MKCPKCGYLGFESVERCRNCGYEFSLTSGTRLPELSIRTNASDVQPLDDLAMVDAALPLATSSARAAAGSTPDLARGAVSASAGPTPELPLFGSAIPDDVPLITKISPPRTPLAVRRATPEVPRLRADVRTPTLDLRAPDLAATPRPVAPVVPAIERSNGHGQVDREAIAELDAASVSTRVLATAIDLAILAVIDLLVAYLTLQISGLEFTDVGLLPGIPMLTFLIVQNISYFVAFTTGGQTLGQMAMAIKVVRDEAGHAPTIRLAILRTFIWLLLTLPAGVGLVTLLFSDERRGLHDRAAGTRVVSTRS